MNGNVLPQGLIVFSAEGTRLGTITSCDAKSFTVGPGEFFDVPYDATYDEILAHKNGALYLSRRDEQLSHERRHVPPIGAAVGYALQEEREIEVNLERVAEAPTSRAG